MLSDMRIPVFIIVVVTTALRVESLSQNGVDEREDIASELSVQSFPQPLQQDIQQRQNRPTGCPAHFIYLHSVNGCYKMVTDMLIWDVAGLRCHAQDPRAHLVIINSADEQRNVVENIAKYYSGCGTNGFWTAGQRVNPGTAYSQLVWKIVNGDSCPKMTEITYTHWLKGEPNSNPTGLESCLHVWQYVNYQWNDEDCWTPMCGMCEIDM